MDLPSVYVDVCLALSRLRRMADADAEAIEALERVRDALAREMVDRDAQDVSRN